VFWISERTKQKTTEEVTIAWPDGLPEIEKSLSL
jgi:hypothetical protein